MPNIEIIALTTQSVMEAETFQCEVCGRGFKRKSNLHFHMKSHVFFSPSAKWIGDDDGARARVIYTCPVISCRRHQVLSAIATRYGAKRHYISVHGVKPFRCAYKHCIKHYSYPSQVTSHMKTCRHRVFECSCGDRFSGRANFRSHLGSCATIKQLTSAAAAASSDPISD